MRVTADLKRHRGAFTGFRALNTNHFICRSLSSSSVRFRSAAGFSSFLVESTFRDLKRPAERESQSVVRVKVSSLNVTLYSQFNHLTLTTFNMKLVRPLTVRDFRCSAASVSARKAKTSETGESDKS